MRGNHNHSFIPSFICPSFTIYSFCESSNKTLNKESLLYKWALFLLIYNIDKDSININES